MKIVVKKRFIFIALLLPFAVFPVNLLFEGKASYFIPFNHRFKEIYSGGGIYGVDLSVQAWKNLYPFLSVDYFQKSGRSILDDGSLKMKGDQTKIQFVPIGAGLKYIQRINARFDFYAGLGATATYLHIKDHYEDGSQVLTNWGPGFIVKIGSLVTLCQGLFLDFAIDYRYAKVDFSKPYTPANLDGLSLGGGMGYRF